jgi:hypothetical protein
VVPITGNSASDMPAIASAAILLPREGNEDLAK